MYQKKSIRRAPEDLRALMRISNGLELELRALNRQIEARRDLHKARRESISSVVSEAGEVGILFHHGDYSDQGGDK